MKTVPDWLYSKWQEFADILAEILNVPAVLVMYTQNEYMEVFLSSNSNNNPYKVGDRDKWYGLYCETVIKSQQKLLIPNALKDPKWDKNPDIKLGMISYLGFPVNFPDDTPFGTVCVLDNKENGYNKTYEKMLYQFREVVETDISLVYAFDLKTKKLNKTIFEQHASLKEKQAELEESNRELKFTNQELHVTNGLLKEAKEKAEESDQLKTAFMQNLSHEIRTPMNGIMGFASLLNESNQSEEKRTYYANLITKNCSQLLSIVTDIMEISQIQTGQLTTYHKPVDIMNLFNEVLLYNKPRAAAKNLSLKIMSVQEFKNIKLETDKDKLKSVLQNLISNAIKYSDKGEIEVGCTAGRNCIEFFVQDNGIGIDEEHLQVVFEPFRQAETTLTRRYGGTGLGLSICKGYVELLGGNIWAESEPGQGSVFKFRLPNPGQHRNQETKNVTLKVNSLENPKC